MDEGGADDDVDDEVDHEHEEFLLVHFSVTRPISYIIVTITI